MRLPRAHIFYVENMGHTPTLTYLHFIYAYGYIHEHRMYTDDVCAFARLYTSERCENVIGMISKYSEWVAAPYKHVYTAYALCIYCIRMRPCASPREQVYTRIRVYIGMYIWDTFTCSCGRIYWYDVRMGRARVYTRRRMCICIYIYTDSYTGSVRACIHFICISMGVYTLFLHVRYPILMGRVCLCVHVFIVYCAGVLLYFYMLIYFWAPLHIVPAAYSRNMYTSSRDGYFVWAPTSILTRVCACLHTPVCSPEGIKYLWEYLIKWGGV